MPVDINSQTGLHDEPLARLSQKKVEHPKTALLIGAGYTALRLVPYLQSEGYTVWGTTRSDKTVAMLLNLQAIPIITEDFKSQDLRSIFERADIILSSVPPSKVADKKGFHDPVISALGDITPRAQWMGYYSATSVYGDRKGQWAFEGEPANPQLKRGLARAEAELEWLETSWPIHIFRLAGIYGPGRDPFTKFKNGTVRAVIKLGHIVNRIHVSDIISATLASIKNPHPQRIYNLADGQPAPPQDVLDYAADLMGVPHPPRVMVLDDSVSDMARSFYSETKRIDNGRARRELKWEPQYANYKEGLASIWRNMPS